MYSIKKGEKKQQWLELGGTVFFVVISLLSLKHLNIYRATLNLFSRWSWWLVDHVKVLVSAALQMKGLGWSK